MSNVTEFPTPEPVNPSGEESMDFGAEELLVIPDQWIIKAPEDPTLPFLLNFYKDGNIVTTFPLTEENLAQLLPVLETFVEKEPVETVGIITRTQQWVKNHKFSAALAVLIGILLLVGIGLTATTALGAG